MVVGSESRSRTKEAARTMFTPSVGRVLPIRAFAVLATLFCLGLPTAAGQTSTASTSERFGDLFASAPETGPNSSHGLATAGLLDVICESIFGEASVDGWRPLSLSTFFSEGWDEPYAKSPDGTNGAPKQNWFGSSD